MTEFTKILVATDFSDHAREAVRTGASLAKRFAAPMVLVHVYQPMTYALPPGYMMYTGETLTDMMHLFETQLEGAAVEARAAGAPEVKTALPAGNAAHEIVETARAEHCDLIVVGTQGRTGLGHMLLGSTAERVVRTAECAVLTVKVRNVDAAT